ncbi:hypothetical protein KC19_6G218900 [Ceratodon purpureus]|uniref:Uncharacterized protein n=1 Tax=Ceratodon purpureus TaxID=3225 RepID=A0A8T0HK62_CERPU|nr:hypothetical protein KC19_6G218900 [Ceratodon purpureus]
MRKIIKGELRESGPINLHEIPMGFGVSEGDYASKCSHELVEMNVASKALVYLSIVYRKKLSQKNRSKNVNYGWLWSTILRKLSKTCLVYCRGSALHSFLIG